MSRREALIVARAHGSKGQSLGELIVPLARFAPPELTPAAWCDRLAEVVSGLQQAGVLDDEHRLRDRAELARRIGKHTARDWRQLSDGVLPGLALGIAADDGKLRARLDSRDAWAAAIVGRASGLWLDGPPPSLPAMCDALVWRELALPGKPKRCPPELRALFIQRQLAAEPAAPDRLVRVLAAREAGAPRSELRALRDALVRGWLAGRWPRSFAGDALAAAAAAHDGWFGERQVFVSAAWDQLRRTLRWSALSLADFKARLVAAHRAGELVLERADLVGAMDPAVVAASEIAADGAEFHFIVKEPA